MFWRRNFQFNTNYNNINILALHNATGTKLSNAKVLFKHFDNLKVKLKCETYLKSYPHAHPVNVFTRNIQRQNLCITTYWKNTSFTTMVKDTDTKFRNIKIHFKRFGNQVILKSHTNLKNYMHAHPGNVFTGNIRRQNLCMTTFWKNTSFTTMVKDTDSKFQNIKIHFKRFDNQKVILKYDTYLKSYAHAHRVNIFTGNIRRQNLYTLPHLLIIRVTHFEL